MIQTLAVLIIDMAGFSVLCERDGIEAGRARVREFRGIAEAAVNAHTGSIVKSWADNIAAVFPTVRQAVGAAETVTQLIPSSAGIGFGETVLEDGDLWGVEVNRASRLGEDIAGVGQVLLTDAARLNL